MKKVIVKKNRTEKKVNVKKHKNKKNNIHSNNREQIRKRKHSQPSGT